MSEKDTPSYSTDNSNLPTQLMTPKAFDDVLAKLREAASLETPKKLELSPIYFDPPTPVSLLPTAQNDEPTQERK